MRFVQKRTPGCNELLLTLSVLLLLLLPLTEGLEAARSLEFR
jgi:hypothetical protein